MAELLENISPLMALNRLGNIHVLEMIFKAPAPRSCPKKWRVNTRCQQSNQHPVEKRLTATVR